LDIQELFKERGKHTETDMYHHLPYLRQVVINLKAKQVIELGVRTGESTVAFLAGLAETGGKLWSCDIQSPLEVTNHGPGNPIKDHIWGKYDNWEFVKGNDLQVAKQAPKRCDVLFIDTEHTYEQAVAELEAYGPRVRPGGVILMHDTYGLQPKNQVVQAISKYMDGKDDLTLTNDSECYGLATIRVARKKKTTRAKRSGKRSHTNKKSA